MQEDSALVTKLLALQRSKREKIAKLSKTNEEIKAMVRV